MRMMVRPENGSSWKVGSTMSVDDLFAEALKTNLSDLPLMEVLVRMQSDVQAASGLDDRTYVLVRIAALAALDASAESYLVNFTIADELGVSADDVRGVLIALAPLIGTARTVTAANRSMQAIRAA
jgi:alkylhydroperoxidase/carboxymuconolactone decarboxylase family protein YurZ